MRTQITKNKVLLHDRKGHTASAHPVRPSGVPCPVRGRMGIFSKGTPSLAICLIMVPPRKGLGTRDQGVPQERTRYPSPCGRTNKLKTIPSLDLRTRAATVREKR